MPKRSRKNVSKSKSLDATTTPDHMLPEPLEAEWVRQRARLLLAAGPFIVAGHAELRMKERGISLVDVANVIRGGRPSPDQFCTFEQGSWRYRLETTKDAVVIAFDETRTKMVLVTVIKLGSDR